jgi:hypothetical protein
MELKGILEACVGCLLAFLLGPVVLSGFTVAMMWVQAQINQRERDRASRKKSAIREAMRRNPGKTWTLHGPEGFDTHDDDWGDSGTLV